MMTVRHLLMAGTAAFILPLASAYAAPPADTLVVGISADASTFDPAAISMVIEKPAPQLPHEPPQPSSPHARSAQLGAHDGVHPAGPQSARLIAS